MSKTSFGFLRKMKKQKEKQKPEKKEKSLKKKFLMKFLYFLIGIKRIIFYFFAFILFIFGKLFKKKNGLEVAKKVIEIAKVATGRHDVEGDVFSQNELSEIKKDILKNEKNLYELANEDRKDAREMQATALNQKDKFTKRFIYYLAGFWSITAAVFLFSITFVDIPQSSIRFADTILGFLMGTVISSILGFFFGSSAIESDRQERQN